MRGHEPLIALRRRGLRPLLAIVDMLPGYTEVTATRGGWHENSHRGQVVAHVEVLEAESVGRLDLRCLVGLHVIVSGEDDAAVMRLHRACIDAGAVWVLSHVMQRREDGSEIVGEFLHAPEVAHG